MAIELLCPAGGFEQLRAAVGAGCDAVYFGGGAFNARANAENFDGEEIVKAVNFCRLFGVKAYITVNTVLTGRMLARAVSFVSFLEQNAPADAYIVQDLGLMSEIHSRFPSAHIHASTQMALHSSPCAEILRPYGVTRVIAARETPRDDIASLCKQIETEVFVHGALCVSQSGGCLFSSMVGQNSGNSGKCAQPCRLAYKCAEPYALSLKDNCLAGHITELMDIGVASLKIEGRMKDARYVAAVTSVYRRLIDEKRDARPDEIRYLADVFSRSGFTDAYFTAKPTVMSFGVRTDADKERTRKARVDVKEPTLPVDIHCRIENDAPSEMTFTCGGVSATEYGMTPQTALTAPLDASNVVKSVSKLGTTHFTAKTVSADVGEGLNLPVSALNSLRRDVCALLEGALIAHSQPKREATSPVVEREHINVAPADYTVLRFEGLFLPQDASIAPDADFFDIPLNMLRSAGIVASNPEKVRLIMPRVVFDSETEKTVSMLNEAREMGVRHAVVSNISQIPMTSDFVRHGNLNLNIANAAAMEVLAPYLESVCVSPEIPRSVIQELKSTRPELVVYGKLPLMHTETCIIRRIKGNCTGSGRCHAYLTDRLGEKFFVIRETKHRSVIYNSRPLWLADKADAKIGKIYLFTDESEGIIRSVIAGAIPERYTRGYY